MAIVKIVPDNKFSRAVDPEKQPEVWRRLSDENIGYESGRIKEQDAQDTHPVGDNDTPRQT
ncbi:MAG: hypothetical protein RLO18_28870, partial [Gimesia chilikensis]